MTYPLSSPVVEGQATEANQYNYLRQDALYLGGDPAASGTVRDLLYSTYGDLPLSALGSNTILLSASVDAPAAVMIGGVVLSVFNNITLSLNSDDLPSAGRYTIYAVASSGGAFVLALSGSGSYRAIGSFCWDGSGIIPGTVHNLRDLSLSALVNSPAAAAGRLTLVAGNPVPDADITMGDNLYFVPYKGNRIGLYLYGAWEYFDFSGISIGKSGLTAGIPYDVFLSADSDGLRLSVSAWITTGSRAVGTLAWVDGVRVSGSDYSKRYLGSFVINESGYYEDSSDARLLWNENNRLARPILSLLITSKTRGASHENVWAPYYDEDAPFVRLLVPVSDCEFELTGVGLNSSISESDRGNSRSAALGILRDPMTESPFTGNKSCVPVFTHTVGNTPMTCEAENLGSEFQGVHDYYLGFWSNYIFYPIGTSLSGASGECPGLFGQIYG